MERKELFLIESSWKIPTSSFQGFNWNIAVTYRFMLSYCLDLDSHPELCEQPSNPWTEFYLFSI